MCKFTNNFVMCKYYYKEIIAIVQNADMILFEMSVLKKMRPHSEDASV